MLKRPVPPWKHREHLFTPENITKLEFLTAREKMNHTTCHMKIKLRPLPPGPVKHLLNRGVFILLTTEEEFYEDLLILKGPQLPEDRSGEPDQFYLED